MALLEGGGVGGWSFTTEASRLASERKVKVHAKGQFELYQ